MPSLCAAASQRVSDINRNDGRMGIKIAVSDVMRSSVSEFGPAGEWRGLSGRWMAFYSAALAILYSAARTADTSPRCTNGHVAPSNAAYCLRCGHPVLRVR